MRSLSALMLLLLVQHATSLHAASASSEGNYNIQFECHGADRPKVAAIPDSARIAFSDGNFAIAANTAESEGSPVALAFAARAHVADAITRAEGICLDCLLRAEAVAQQAVAAGTSMTGHKCFDTRDFTATRPSLAEAYVQLAIAIGFRGRLVSTLEAQSEGLAEKGRAAIYRALELDPLNIWARASLGGWHLEVVHRAGPILASVLYGANEEQGLLNFRRALTADPNSLLLHYHYALSILALDAKRFRDEALATLEAGSKDTRTDALLAFTHKRADKLNETLKTGSLDDIEALVRRYQGYPTATAEAGAR